MDISSHLQYSDHQAGHGRAFFEKACALSIEGTVSKRIDAPYAPGNPRALDQPKILRYYDYFGWSCSHVDLGLPLWVLGV